MASPAAAAAAAAAACIPRAALRASCFLRPPGRFKRASLREAPRRALGGPWESVVKAAVRRREKSRAFSLLPPPRQIPVPLPIREKRLTEVRGVPKVSPEALQLRLNFLLGSAASQQQQQTPLKEGLTPYQAELFMWERQMREVRRIYRAQFLQRLAEVSLEEQQRQQQLLQQAREDKRIRREETLQRILESKKRRAILLERQQIEAKVTQAVQLGRVSRKKAANLLWLDKLQKASHLQREEREALEAGGPPEALDDPHKKQRAEAEAKREALKKIEERNVSATQLLSKLGFCEETRGPPNKRITGTDDVFREVLEASFDLLPEDGPPTFAPGRRSSDEKGGPLSPKQRAAIEYAAFSDEEKLALLDEKVQQLTRQIERQAEVRGAPTDLLLVQLRDHLEAAKQAYLEGRYLEETEKRMQQQQQQQPEEQQEQDHEQQSQQDTTDLDSPGGSRGPQK